MKDPQGWPTCARRIGRASSPHWRTWLPLAFFSFYIVYPILYALVCSHGLQSIGRFHSERGIAIGDLHYLITAKSVGDALTAGLRSCHQSPFIGLSIASWALSPIGSQASLRMLYTTQQLQVSNATFRYLDTGPLRHSLLHWSLDEGSSYIRWTINNKFEHDFHTVMAQPYNTFQSQRDFWGNAKIPRIEDLNVPSDSTEWWDTTAVNGPDSFSSPLGIAIHELPSAFSKDLTIEASYISTSCATLRQVGTSSDSLDIPRFHFRLSCPHCPVWNVDLDRRCNIVGFEDYRCSRLAAFLGLGALNARISDPLSILVDIGISDDTTANDNVTDEKHVEARIRCEGETCYTTAIRNSQHDKRPETVTPLDFWASKYLTNERTNRLIADPIFGYLYGPVPDPSRSVNASKLFDHVTSEQLSSRLGAILNIFTQLDLGGTVIRPLNISRDYPAERVATSQDIWGPEYTPPGGLKLASHSADLPLVWKDLRRYYEERRNLTYVIGGYGSATAIAKTSTSTEIYKVNPIWVTLSFFCSLTVIAVGVIGIWCESRVVIPSRFDAVLGLTYNNRDMGLTTDGSVLGTDERLRLLKHVQVKVGDVMADGDTGRIALGASRNVAFVRKGRFYE
ncbi:hypothetical protein GGR57DRAFT_515030 [Xylariaceae sp. FL1272]|nr:hypothetical protein GGR57DRAFT_515030 [Xylariaceae sp. FL1272]